MQHIRLLFLFFFPAPAGALVAGSWGVGALEAPFGVVPAVGAGVADERTPAEF